MDGETTRASAPTSVLAEHDVREHGVVDVVSEMLRDAHAEIPEKIEIMETFQEVANFLRSQDLNQREVERVLRLLRRRCLRYVSVSVALKRWSRLNG